MNKPKPSEAFVKAHRDWTNAVEDLKALNDRLWGDSLHKRAPSKDQLDLKASLEAKIAGLEKANPALME